MINLWLFFTAWGALFTAENALAMPIESTFAGTEGNAGNGGGAFICQHPENNQLLDFFEAEIPGIVADLGLSIRKSNQPVEVQVLEAFKRVGEKSWVYSRLLLVYSQIKAAQVFPMKAGYIAWPSDADNAVVKPGCTPTGIILFNDLKNSMLKDPVSFALLSPTDQAGLWVHETIYKFLRELQHVHDSIAARKLVAHLFSTESNAEVAKAFWDVSRLDVHSSENHWPSLAGSDGQCDEGKQAVQFSWVAETRPPERTAVATEVRSTFQTDWSGKTISGDVDFRSGGGELKIFCFYPGKYRVRMQDFEEGACFWNRCSIRASLTSGESKTEGLLDLGEFYGSRSDEDLEFEVK